MPTPYADHYLEVIESGLGTPLPGSRGRKRSKFCSLPGVTGSQGTEPSPEQYAEWVQDLGWANCVVRPARDVIGLDVDTLGHGNEDEAAESLARLVKAGFDVSGLRVSARDPESSHGVYYCRLPEGVDQAELNDLPGIQVIRWGWRVAPWPGNLNPDADDAVYRLLSGATEVPVEALAQGLVTAQVLTDEIVSMLRKQNPSNPRMTVSESPIYSELSINQRVVVDTHVQAQIQLWRNRYKEAQEWSEGDSDSRGRRWEILARDGATSLAYLATAPWCPIDEDRMEQIYLDMLGDIGEDDKCKGKWEGVLRWVSTQETDAPPWTKYRTAMDDFGDVVGITTDLTGRVTRAIELPVIVGMENLVLPSPSDLDAVASYIIGLHWTNRDQCLVLRTWLGSSYEWHTTHWRKVPPMHLFAVILRILSAAKYWKTVKGSSYLVDWSPNPTRINNLIALIEAKTLIHAERGSGYWIDCTSGRCPEGDHGRQYISFQNGILDMSSLEMIPHDSAFFNTYSLGFDYDPEAAAPTWERSLKQWFPDDEESQRTVEETIAYLVLGGLELDKIFVWLGEPRAGKGTIMRVVQRMLGQGYATMSMDDLTDRFAVEDLIPLLVCHIAEATSTRETRKVVSLIKSISGRDFTGTSVKMKGEKSAQDVTLEVKFVLTGNEELELPDSSGVIIERMVVLSFQQSFLGREDPGLEAKLEEEASGIFNWILSAHRSLLTRGKFLQPASGEAVKERLRATAAPEKTWFNETFEVTGDTRDVVKSSDAVDLYIERFNVQVMTANLKLSALLPVAVRQERITENGVKVRILRGVRLRAEEQEG